MDILEVGLRGTWEVDFFVFEWNFFALQKGLEEVKYGCMRVGKVLIIF